MAQAGFDPAAIERMGVMPNAEKFAELLINECAHVGVNAAYPFKGTEVLVAIKNHFGLREQECEQNGK